jgi:hypothetical protein
MEEERKKVRIQGKIFTVKKVRIPGNPLETILISETKGRRTAQVRDPRLIIEVLESLRRDAEKEEQGETF